MNIDNITEISAVNFEGNREEELANNEPKEILKTKRNPFEKIIDDSIIICDTSAEKFKQVNADSKDINLKENFVDFKSDLQNIKNQYEYKKKLLQKRTTDGGEEPTKPETSKKKKVNNVKSVVMVDTSEIVKRIEENELRMEKEVKEAGTPRKNSGQEDNMILSSPKPETKEKIVKSDGAQKKGAANGSDKKNKNENQNTNNLLKYFTKSNPASTNNINKQKVSLEQLSLEDNPNNNCNLNKVNKLNSTYSPLKVIDSDKKVTPFDNKNNNNKSTLDNIENESESKEPRFIINPSSVHNSTTLDFNHHYIPVDCPPHKLKFYNIKGREIKNISDYEKTLKKYYRENVNNNEIKRRGRRRKIIYIHESFMSHIKFTDKTSKIINPRNPFKKDEFIIDYDKDSEEEYLEENAEDIKSNENSADDEELNEEDEEEGGKWIVPDGHLSEDEVSEKDELNFKESSEVNKTKSIIDLLNIRKNYSKPVIVTFSTNTIDNRVKDIQNLLKARVYNPNNPSSNNNNNNTENNNISNINDFPISITSKKLEETVKKGNMNTNIKDRLDDITREIHYSYMTKDHIIREITKKYSTITKNAMENFFKNSVIRSKCEKTGRKQWLVKMDVISTLNLNPADHKEMFNNQTELWKVKEEEKEKEKKMEILQNELIPQNLSEFSFNNVNAVINNSNINNTNKPNNTCNNSNIGKDINFNLGTIGIINSPDQNVNMILEKTNEEDSKIKKGKKIKKEKDLSSKKMKTEKKQKKDSIKQTASEERASLQQEHKVFDLNSIDIRDMLKKKDGNFKQI